jgi:hypothetical protein
MRWKYSDKYSLTALVLEVVIYDRSDRASTPSHSYVSLYVLRKAIRMT